MDSTNETVSSHELTGNVHAQGLHKSKQDEVPVLREVSGHEVPSVTDNLSNLKNENLGFFSSGITSIHT